MRFRQTLLQTADDHALTILRIALGTVILAHGLQKLMGWFGGHGVEWTLTMWAQWFSLPAWVTMLVILGESFGAFSLVLGLFTRLMAGVIGVIMVGAVYLVHAKSGFFMNWYSQPQGEGFEYHILVFAMAVCLVMKGGGKYSLDSWLVRKQVHR